MARILQFQYYKSFFKPKILEKIARVAQKFGKFGTFSEAQNIFSRHSMKQDLTDAV